MSAIVMTSTTSNKTCRDLMKHQERRYLKFSTLCIFLLSISIVVITQPVPPGASRAALLKDFLFRFYITYPVSLDVITLFERNIFIWLNLISFFSAAAAALLFKSKFKQHHAADPFWKALFYAVIISCVFASVFQLTAEARKFYLTYKFFQHTTLDQKKEKIFRTIYLFSNFAHRILPGEHNTLLVTTLDINKDPGMIIHRSLSYLLWPIDIRHIRDGEIDSVIIMDMPDPEAAVPDGFVILAKYNEKTIIASKVKK